MTNTATGTMTAEQTAEQDALYSVKAIPAVEQYVPGLYDPRNDTAVVRMIAVYAYVLYVPNAEAVEFYAVPILMRRINPGTNQPFYPTLPETLPGDPKLVRKLVHPNGALWRLYPYKVEGECRAGARDLGLDPAIGDYYLMGQ